MLLLRPSSSSSSSRTALPAALRAVAIAAWALMGASQLGGAEATQGAVRGGRQGPAAASGAVVASAGAAADESGSGRRREEAAPHGRSLAPEPVIIDFAEYPDGFIGNLYEPRYGVVFSPNAVSHVTSNDAEDTMILYFAASVSRNAYFTVSGGFTDYLQFRIYNSAGRGLTMTFVLYDGPGVAGNVLAQQTLTAGVDAWTTVTIPFSGVARAVSFQGGDDVFFAEFTDIEFVPAEPECEATTYWVWDPNTDQVVAELTDKAVLCLPQPYNIEARPCSEPAATPVRMTLQNAVTGTNVYRRNENAAPYFLWGDDPVTGDVFRNLRRLADGTYSLQATIEGVQETILFKQQCLV